MSVVAADRIAFAIQPTEISGEMAMNDTIAPFVFYMFFNGCDCDGYAIDEPQNDPENRSNMKSLMMDISKSYNYSFSHKKPEAGVDSIVYWSLRIRDTTLNARAHLVFFDDAGNRRDTLINCLSTASVDDSKLSNSINLFNESNTLHFYSDNDYIIDEIMIFDLTGKVVMTEKVNQSINELNVKLPDLQRGVYLIRLFISGKWVNKKIII
jgi:hypothetical protein